MDEKIAIEERKIRKYRKNHIDKISLLQLGYREVGVDELLNDFGQSRFCEGHIHYIFRNSDEIFHCRPVMLMVDFQISTYMN